MLSLFDGHGSQRTVTNGSQAVTGSINYDSFGNTAGSTGSSTSPYLYGASSGYRTEGDAGLTHVRARFYDAQVGRFVSRDSVLTEHPYLYCEHDPVNRVDPSGHLAPPLAWAIILVAATILVDAAGPRKPEGDGFVGVGVNVPPFTVGLDGGDGGIHVSAGLFIGTPGVGIGFAPVGEIHAGEGYSFGATAGVGFEVGSGPPKFRFGTPGFGVKRTYTW